MDNENSNKLAAKAHYDRIVQITGFVRERLIGDIPKHTPGLFIVRGVDMVNEWLGKNFHSREQRHG